jgi:hypothetical protein
VLWQTLRMTHPVQLRRSPLVSPCSKQAGLPRPSKGSSASLSPTGRFRSVADFGALRYLQRFDAEVIREERVGAVGGGQSFREFLCKQGGPCHTLERPRRLLAGLAVT